MQKIINATFKILLIIGLFIIAGIICVLIFCNPNHYKDDINHIVQKYTARNLIIDGNISWSFFPYLGLSVENITLSNRSNFNGQFLTASKANIKISLKGLLQKKIVLQSIKINQPKIYLVKAKNGQTNFADLLDSKANRQDAIAAGQVNATKISAPTTNANTIHLLIKEVLIENANIDWNDNGANTHLALEQVNISTTTLFGDLGQKSWPLQISGKLKDLSNNHTQEFDFSAKVQPDFQTQTFIFDPITIKKENLNITAHATAHTSNNIIKIEPLMLEVLGSKHHASCKVDLTKQTPIFSIKDKTNTFEIYDLLAEFAQYRNLHGKANLNIDCKANGKQIHQLKSTLSGTLALTINHGSYDGMDIHAILKQAEAAMSTLTSSITNKVTPNIPAILSQANNVRTEVAKDKERRTNFDVLHITANFKNGVSHETNFSIEHHDYSVHGNGELNLANDTINMQIKAFYRDSSLPQNKTVANFMQKTPIDIKVHGNLYHPTVTPNMESYLKDALGKLPKELFKNILKGAVPGLLIPLPLPTGNKDSSKPKETVKDIGDRIFDKLLHKKSD